jgi:hypothetical protein
LSFNLGRYPPSQQTECQLNRVKSSCQMMSAVVAAFTTSRGSLTQVFDSPKLGDIVRVKVLEVDMARKRIALTLRLDDGVGSRTAAVPRRVAHRTTRPPCAPRNKAAVRSPMRCAAPAWRRNGSSADCVRLGRAVARPRDRGRPRRTRGPPKYLMSASTRSRHSPDSDLWSIFSVDVSPIS